MPLRYWCLGFIFLTAACPGEDKDETGTETGDSDPPSAIEWTIAREDDEAGAFLAAWGATEEEIWIVGGQPDEGAVLRGHDQTWSPIPLPPGIPLLNWVHGTSADNIWVVGIQGTLLHWDGSSWDNHSLDVNEAIWGVYVLSENEAWAVGGESGFGGESALALRWDGMTWNPLTLPPEVSDLRNLFKVSHDGTQVWMVGTQGTALRSADGETLSQVATGYAGDLITVNHHTSGGLLVVGGRGTGVVLEPNGDGLATTLQANAGLNGVQVFPSGRSLVVGELGYTGIYDAQTDTVESVVPITTDVLHGAFGRPGGTMYAVGGNLYTAGDRFHGVILTAPAIE